MTQIDDVAKWTALASELARSGYKIWQMQYDTDHPEGFHVWFAAHQRPTVEVMTRNDAVYDAIVKYRA